MNTRTMRIRKEITRKDSARVSISVPVPIREMMFKYQRKYPKVNWSRVAAMAFEQRMLRKMERGVNGSTKEGNGKKTR